MQSIVTQIKRLNHKLSTAMVQADACLASGDRDGHSKACTKILALSERIFFLTDSVEYQG